MSPRNYAAVLPFWKLWGALNGCGLVPPIRTSRLRFLARPKSSKTVVMFMKKHPLSCFQRTSTERPSVNQNSIGPHSNTAWWPCVGLSEFNERLAEQLLLTNMRIHFDNIQTLDIS